MPRALLWDMDGTLVDTADLHRAAWEQLGLSVGRPITPDDFRTTFGWRNPEILDYLCPDRWSSAEMAELGERKEVAYRAAARSQGVLLLPGVRELLTWARAAGLPQAIGSSAPRANLELLLELTGTAPFFQALVGMEDTTQGKPHPQVFLVGAERLGVAPSACVVIEDATAGVRAARAAGMRCVAIARPGHHSAADLRAAGADLVTSTLAELSLADLLG
ncbi:MAG TPA: HAD family phosphatase [Gemmatales bacterium]|mgnify:FL=1|nr:HAD family phosphatase [Gemmatales bacterium]